MPWVLHNNKRESWYYISWFCFSSQCLEYFLHCRGWLGHCGSDILQKCPWAKHFIPNFSQCSAASSIGLQLHLQQEPRGRHNTHCSLSAKVAKATVQRQALRLQYVPFLFFSPLSDLLVAELHPGRRREWDKYSLNTEVRNTNLHFLFYCFNKRISANN